MVRKGTSCLQLSEFFYAVAFINNSVFFLFTNSLHNCNIVYALNLFLKFNEHICVNVNIYTSILTFTFSHFVKQEKCEFEMKDKVSETLV